MTQEEAQQVKAATLLDAHDTKQRLNTIKVRAERVGAAIVRIGEAMKSDPSLLLNSEWKATTVSDLVSNPSAYNESEFRAAINYDYLLKLADDYQKAVSHLATVTSQMRRLGLTED